MDSQSTVQVINPPANSDQTVQVVTMIRNDENLKPTNTSLLASPNQFSLDGTPNNNNATMIGHNPSSLKLVCPTPNRIQGKSSNTNEGNSNACNNEIAKTDNQTSPIHNTTEQQGKDMQVEVEMMKEVPITNDETNNSSASTSAVAAALATATAMIATNNSATTSTPPPSSSKLSQSREENWETMFQELAKYKQETGHCLVPKVFPGEFINFSTY